MGHDLELAEHAVLYAEGAPAESYLETGNRSAFQNGGPAISIHPDFGQAVRETKGCAPFVEAGSVVECVRQRILERAGIEMTPDPAVSICYENGAATIESRSAVPGEIFADPSDRRLLGVKIASLEIGGETIPINHPSLVDGWHDLESDGRWTNGHAVIPKQLVGECKSIKISITSTLLYPLVPNKTAPPAEERVRRRMRPA